MQALAAHPGPIVAIHHAVALAVAYPPPLSLLSLYAMTVLDEYDTLDDVKDVDDLEGLVVGPLAHLSAHMYGTTFAGRSRGPGTLLATMGQEAATSWGRSISASDGARICARFWPKGAIFAYPRPQTPMIVTIRVEHVAISGTRRITSVALSVALLLPIHAFECINASARLRVPDAALWIPGLLHSHVPTKPSAPAASQVLKQAMSSGPCILATTAVRALQEEFFTGFKPLRGKMAVVTTSSPLAIRRDDSRTSSRTSSRASVQTYVLDEGALAGAAAAALLGQPSVASSFSGSVHLAAAEVLGLTDMSTLVALRALKVAHNALPRSFCSVRGYPLFVAAALRMACAPDVYGLKRSYDDGCDELNERFVAQWRPLTLNASGHALYGIDVVLLNSIADANSELESSSGSTKRPSGPHHDASRIREPRVHANLALMACSARRLVETIFARGGYLVPPDIMRSDTLAYAASSTDVPLAIDATRAARQDLMSEANAEQATRAHKSRRQSCPWPFAVIPAPAARDAVVTLLDDVERYCRRMQKRSVADERNDSDVDDGVQDSDDDSNDGEQDGAADLSWCVRDAARFAANDQALPRKEAVGLLSALANQGIALNLDPFLASAPATTTLGQRLGGQFLSSCIAHGAADIALTTGLVSRVVSPHSTTQCFMCKRQISGLDTLVTLPYGQCVNCESYRCYHCVQDVPMPANMHCAACVEILEDKYDYD